MARCREAASPQTRALLLSRTNLVGETGHYLNRQIAPKRRWKDTPTTARWAGSAQESRTKVRPITRTLPSARQPVPPAGFGATPTMASRSPSSYLADPARLPVRVHPGGPRVTL